MTHKTGVTTMVLLVVMAALVLAGAEGDLRTVIFSYTAERQNAGDWNFLVKTGGNEPRLAQPRMDVGIQLRETGDSQSEAGGRWVEVQARFQVKGVGEPTRHDLDCARATSVPDDTTKAPQDSTKAPQVSTMAPQVSSTLPQKKTFALPVPPGYNDIGGMGYYKVHRDPAKWETARRRCAKEGGHLLIINSALEAEVVVVSGMHTWNWVGFDDYATEGEFVTLHGTTLDEAGYMRWAPNEPEKGLRCGVANENGLLGSGNCDAKREYMCEFRNSTESVQERRKFMAPMGYRALGTLGYYRVHRDPAKWETARRRCEAEGAHLLVPNSATEAAAVLRTTGLPSWAWVGFDDFGQHRQYINFDGQYLGSSGVYSKFAPKEPDHKLRCGVALPNGDLGTGNCNLKREYICELYKQGEQPKKPNLSTSPPVGYIALGHTSFYKVHHDRVPWETARRRCRAEGAHLLVVNSQAEADAVLKTCGLPEWFWVGFDDFDNEGEYVTELGPRLVDSGYVKWASGEPTIGLNCGVARANGLLGTGTCKVEREYICEWERSNAAPQPQPSPYPSGYRPIGTLGYYKVHHDRVPWETARRRCRAEGAHLLVVNSQAEADAVLKTCGLPEWFWVGFDDFDDEGEYVTELGTTLQEAGYQKWSPGEPYRDLNCGVARVNGLLGTGNCKLDREYICELSNS